MATLTFQFELDLPAVDNSSEALLHQELRGIDQTFHTGPYFYLWQPQGESDAISLPTNRPDAALSVWFDGWDGGYPDGSRVEDYSSDDDLTDPSTLLEGGCLAGKLILYGVPDETIGSLHSYIIESADDTDKEHDRIDGGGHAERFVELATDIMRIIEPPLRRFLDILRYTFGQIWIRDLPRWETGAAEIKHFFPLFLSFEWSDDGNTWHDFRPPVPRFINIERFQVCEDDFNELITEADWNGIRRMVAEGGTPLPATAAFSRAHWLFESGQLKDSLVEACSALDSAVPRIEGSANSDQSSLVARLNDAALNHRELDPTDVILAANAIRHRNDVVHRGRAVGDDARAQIGALLRIVWQVLPEPRPKRPRAAVTMRRDSHMLWRHRNE